MAYCTIELLKDVLTKNVTIGSTNALDSVQQGKPATISPKTAGKYINLASQFIDSRLSSTYVTPICRIKIHEERTAIAFSQDKTLLNVSDNSIFKVGSTIRISDNNNTSLFRVAEVPDSPAAFTEVTVEPKSPVSYAAGARLSIIEFPDPIPEICAQLAAAMIFDREFVAQQAPDVSNYGKSLRGQATNALDKILAGAIRLPGQDHTGRRFVRTSLRDTMSTTAEFQPGTEKE